MYSTYMVDASQVWWTQHASGVYRHVDVFIWWHRRNLPILFLPTLLQPFGPAECLCLQHLLIRRHLCHLPFRKLSHVGRQRPKCGRICANNGATVVIVLFRFRIP